MLLLQVTDGVQNLEAMEYQPISALNLALRPGAKLQLRGQMVCRLGMLLLGPQNVQVMGGEVEDLVDRNSQGRVLRRALGLPAEEPQNGGGVEEHPAVPQQANGDMEDLDLDDQELLASLEAQEELDRAQARARGTSVMDSGYGTGSILSTDPAHPPLSMSESSTPSHARDPVRAGRNAWSGPIGDSVLFDPPSNEHEEDRFPDEDFDDLPLDELDSVVFQDGPEETPPLDSSRSRRETAAPSSLRRSSPPGLRASASGAHRLSRGTAAKRPFVSSPGIPDDVLLLPDDDGDNLMDVDIDYCFPEEMDTPPRTSRDSAGAPSGPPLQEGDRNEAVSAPHPMETADRNPGPAFVPSSASPVDVPGGVVPTVGHHRRPSGSAVVVVDDDEDDDDDAQTLASPPFTYLRLLQARWPRPQQRHGASVRVKAFIVTLLGKLTSAAGAWRVRATVSDGTGYLDVELSDQVLRGLLGFTVAQKCALKRDPGRRAELDAGMRRCQEEMVDMCGVMTLAFEEQGGKAVVTRVEPVTEEDLRALERRVSRRETERRT
ncbi:hypothetical protein CRUP_019952 [Coryphaenoides rupestris]|nr:hypothetical protein CRUP_019952 [Coryphaenoides rupestris]